MILRILVFCMFGVTKVRMQRSTAHLTTQSGIFDSGGYPDTAAVDHAYEITVDQDHQILLQFLDFSLNETASCTVDVLELYNGGKSDNVLIDHFCWDDVTALASTAYISTGNQLYLRLTTTKGYSRKGFRARYISVDLEHTNPSGEIRSPGYPNTSQPLDEAWRIKVNGGYQIRLEFLDFALHMSLPCVNDYFEIYGGASNRYCLLERWCWKSLSELPQTVYISTGNILYLRLRTMYGFPRKGFNASYISIPRLTTLSSGMDITGNARFRCGSSKATTLVSMKVSTQTVLNNDISVTATSYLKNGSMSSTLPSTQNVSTQTVLNNDISVTAVSNLTNGSTISTIPPIKHGFVAGILAVAVFTVFAIAIIVWKFKMCIPHFYKVHFMRERERVCVLRIFFRKNAKSSPNTGYEKQSQIALNPGEYENVNQQKDAINRAGFETSHERKPVVNVSAIVTTAPAFLCAQQTNGPPNIRAGDQHS